MGRRLPPLPAIEAFLFAARSPSFRAAAQQLALSPSAFSRRLQTLEAFTGVPLFERSAPPTLTAAGRQYYQAVAQRLDEILSATEALRRIPENQRLLVMSPQSLAMNWLMPRLSDFIEQNPDVDVDIVIGRDLNMLRAGKADIALANITHDFTGLPTDPLTLLEGVAVSPRVLAAGRPPPSSLAELSEYRLLGLQHPADFWARWLDRAGYHGPSLGDPTRYETWGVMYEAAASGFGLTIAVSALANRYLRDGRLRPCFDISIQYGGYQIAYASKSTQRRSDVGRLSAWLANEMLQSRDEYYALIGRPASAEGDRTCVGRA
ncbi:MAG: LysR family transcriptional regulator [Caulobacteraceae bacterium]|nr:LysR family transcriptional regulator [Caulobacteraceae bacterium]